MKRGIFILIIMLGLILTSCHFDPNPAAIQGSGKVVSESRPVSGFSQIVINGSAEATITQGDHESLTIEAEDNILPLITSTVANGTLTLEFRTQGSNTSLDINRPIRYTITVKDLSSFLRNGSGDTHIGNLQTKSLALTMQGTGNVTLASLVANQLTVEDDDAGNLSILGGKIGSQSLSIYGAGAISAATLESQSAQVWNTGSGNANIWVENTLQVTITGSGSVTYYGAPVITRNITGTGSLASMGTK